MCDKGKYKGIIQEEEKKKKRDVLCTEHKDKLCFKNELLTRVFRYPVI